MSKVDFPTSRQQGPQEYVATVLKVFTGYNASYGGGRDGLYIKVQFERSGNTRDIFYPTLPAAKTIKLLEALEELKINLEEDGWETLEGYTFRWANETEEREIFDKELGQRRKVPVRLEFPAEIVSADADTATGSNGTTPTVTETEEDVAGDIEAFKDEILEMADGKTMRALRMHAASTASFRAYPADFRTRFNKGEITEELIKEGRLAEVPDGDGGSVFKRAES